MSAGDVVVAVLTVPALPAKDGRPSAKEAIAVSRSPRLALGGVEAFGRITVHSVTVST